MEIYEMRTENMINPIGIDCEKPSFSWKISDTSGGVFQRSYNITVAADESFSKLVWNSGDIISGSTCAEYGGERLLPSAGYYWRAEICDNKGRTAVSNAAYFETGLMGTDKSVWSGAEWIGSPERTINTDSLTEFSFSADFRLSGTNKAGFAICARDKDNYILIEIDADKRLVKAYDYNDNAWSDSVPSVTALGNAGGYFIPENSIPHGSESEWNRAEIIADGSGLILKINSYKIINEGGFIPDNPPNKPRRQCMLSVGFNELGGMAEFKNIEIKNTRTGDVYQNSEKLNDSVLSALGEPENGILTVRNEFRLVNPVPSVNVRRFFDVTDGVKSARLYCSAMGFYDVYINEEKVNRSFYNPGFTDYRKRIYYQTYNVTDKIQRGENVIGAVTAKGYYSGYLGYNAFPMIYGEQNRFIAKLIITYTDGSEKIIVSDDKWQFIDKGPVINADYLQGEDYDARLEFDWSDKSDGRWRKCGAADFPEYASPTNGSFKDKKVPFELTAEEYPPAEIERILPSELFSENPKGHFVYDFGQNMVGTIRLCARAERGTSIKIRYGEMCRRDGRLYTENLRSAANTDTYTFKGGGAEEYIPSLTSHGFRYAEISGNGYTLSENDLRNMDIIIEGLVITNTPERTGYFKCSNDDINKLQSNIEWGQRGNSLLVFTDCPQRNERMGWTGDAQVFAATAAYNMNVRQFMNKWLADVRDAQLLYNRDGAVPDTAPLGGDNRPMGGCGGWADACVIVPWEMYRAYGDIRVLEDNYDMMKKWVDYQALPERRNNGMRIVDGKEMPEESDIARTPFIQIQQSRGDHLAFDESTPFILSATAYAARSAYLLSQIAEILGCDDDARKYKERFENIKKAFREAWVEPDGTLAYWGEMSRSYKDHKGNIINGTYYSEKGKNGARPSQTAYALAIDFGLIPEDKLENAAKAFQRAVDERGGKLSVGFLGISHLATALTKAGLADTAFALLEQTENPGWLYSVKNGATTIWERWNSYIAESGEFGNVQMNSFNHYAYGAVGEWLFGCILGINTSDKKGEAGYRKIILKPHFGGTLKYAKGYYDSVNGIIRSEWRIDGDEFIYKCTVPANTSAYICLPSAVYENITVCGDNLRYKGISEGRAVFEADSGEYLFRVGI